MHLGIFMKICDHWMQKNIWKDLKNQNSRISPQKLNFYKKILHNFLQFWIMYVRNAQTFFKERILGQI